MTDNISNNEPIKQISHTQQKTKIINALQTPSPSIITHITHHTSSSSPSLSPSSSSLPSSSSADDASADVWATRLYHTINTHRYDKITRVMCHRVITIVCGDVCVMYDDYDMITHTQFVDMMMMSGKVTRGVSSPVFGKRVHAVCRSSSHMCHV